MRFSSDLVVGLVGTGGFGREVMPLLIAQIVRHVKGDPRQHVCFVDANPPARELLGLQCLSEEEFFDMRVDHKQFNVAVADPRTRQDVVLRFLDSDIKPHAIKAASTEILGDSQLGSGSILCSQSIVTTNVKIGDFFHANLASYVAHDCEIGNFVTFAPRVACNGNVRIEDHVYVGAGALIKQGTSHQPLVIGAGSVIGMGAVVTRSVPPGTTVVGNPARKV